MQILRSTFGGNSFSLEGLQSGKGSILSPSYSCARRDFASPTRHGKQNFNTKGLLKLKLQKLLNIPTYDLS